MSLIYNKYVLNPLTITVQFGITILPTQPILSGETDFHVVDSVGWLFPGVEARFIKEDGSEVNVQVNEAGKLYVWSKRVA